VAAGADVAKQALAGQGVSMDVRIIDTEKPGWQDQVAALPPDCVVIGGPLRAGSYTALRERGLLAGRVLFAFLSHLPVPEDEGVAAWRFFTSQQDQIDAVLNFAWEQGARSFGVLAPDDAFGQRMAALFTQTAAARALPVSNGTYPAQDMKAWTDKLGEFVGAVKTERGKIPLATASFEAIFLPDSWKNMDMIISTLHYHGAFQKIMLGPVLWEQSLSSARGLNPSTFALTVFPGVWNARSGSEAALRLESGMLERDLDTDAWAVLGYDFILFASALSLNAAPPALAVTRRLAAGFALDWAGAPMSWDREGKARRRLFLFQPSRSGMVPLDSGAFALYRAGAGPPPNRDGADPVPPGSVTVPEELEPELQNLIDSIIGGAARPGDGPPPLPSR
jgi:hypothetical protein